jgi:Na+-transporting NADH:ubiquinone oxidoreductase subunit NqrC
MGLGASQARLLMLVARKSDLEFQLQMVNQYRMQLATIVGNFYSAQSNLDPNSSESKSNESKMGALQQSDKKLEMESRRLDTQHQAVQTEVDAVSKVINKNIEGSFKLMG